MWTPRMIGPRTSQAALALLGGLVLSGCVAQQAHDQALDANRTLAERNAQLVHEVETLRHENALLQQQRTSQETAIAELNRQNAALRQQLQAAGASLDDLRRRVEGLTFGDLDPETDRALAALAAQYPDLIKYDSARGMLRFASDLTFNSGDDTVREEAKASLAALARVLTSSPAAQYEVFIVGHTDAQRIGPVTAQRHPTNMHLSAHRAIAVRSVLASMGVPPERMYIAGWGEHRPAVPNTPSGNTPANRRVEIFLTRPRGVASESTPPPAPPAPARPPAETIK